MKEIVDVKEGADWLLNNRILIHPTDGIWGLGCIATRTAITKIDKLKQRKKNKNYIILFHDIDNALEHIESDNIDRKFIREVCCPPDKNFAFISFKLSSSNLDIK